MRQEGLARNYTGLLGNKQGDTINTGPEKTLQPAIRCFDVIFADRCNQAHKAPVGPANADTVGKHLEFRGNVIGHAMTAAFEPVIDQLLFHALLDDGAVRSKLPDCVSARFTGIRWRAENFPAGAGYTHFR